MKAEDIKKELAKYIIPEKATFLPKFFKTQKGGEGDVFIGVTVPDQRKTAKKFLDLELTEIKKLLYSKVHEYRLTALIILVLRFKKAFKLNDTGEQKKIYDFYLKNKSQVNNWDLVDMSAHYIVGNYVYHNNLERKILYDLARSKNLWEQRIAIIATFYFIVNNELDDTYRIADILLNHKHDLIHKAVGWMLREAGKRDRKSEEQFLRSRYKKMPRTMLRYAIEKFEETKRKKYLKGEI
ncbi:MAG TPA: DNA alkylation repair protein [Candidatus Dojkabacteria bacterium]|jgi:3-methyladenine DNA glycosylase AlkD